MVFVDNKVALRQLELANAGLLARSSLRSSEGKKSIAKDGKFHPRVLTIVSILHVRMPCQFKHMFSGW
jgi:agmatinase